MGIIQNGINVSWRPVDHPGYLFLVNKLSCVKTALLKNSVLRSVFAFCIILCNWDWFNGWYNEQV